MTLDPVDADLLGTELTPEDTENQAAPERGSTRKRTASPLKRDRSPSCQRSSMQGNMVCYMSCANERTEGETLVKADIPLLIHELRKRFGLTQEQFAQFLGVTYSTVNHWENGKRVPQPFLLKRLLEMKAELSSPRRGGGRGSRRSPYGRRRRR
jgi:putative transcriptional regulator